MNILKISFEVCLEKASIYNMEFRIHEGVDGFLTNSFHDNRHNCKSKSNERWSNKTVIRRNDKYSIKNIILTTFIFY